MALLRPREERLAELGLRVDLLKKQEAVRTLKTEIVVLKKNLSDISKRKRRK